jgi:predicted dehydrogenase
MDEAMRAALVGYGYWGPNVARQMFQNKDIVLAKICDKNPDRLAKARQQFLSQVEYTEHDHEVLADPSIDAIAIAVETGAHHKLVCSALKAGKHVYVEKPLASSVSEGEQMVIASAQSGRVVHVNHVMIFHPCIRRIRDIIRRGDLGDPIYVDASRMNLGQVKRDVNAMWDLAIHDLAIIDFLFDCGDPDTVVTFGQKHISPQEIVTFMGLRYPATGMIAHIRSSWLAPVKERRMIIAGTKRMIVYDDLLMDEKLKIYDKGITASYIGSEYGDYVVRTRDGDVFSPSVPVEDALFNSIEHFRQCVEHNVTPLCSPERGTRMLRILDKASRNMVA